MEHEYISGIRSSGSETRQFAEKYHVITDENPVIFSIEPREGDLCPVCKRKYLEFNGLLNLVCPDCGTVSAGCFT